MRKKIVMLLCLSFPVVLFALNENEMDWRYGIYGVRVVTNAPSRAEMAIATNALAQSIIGFIYSPSNLPPAQSTAFATNALYASVSGSASNALTAVAVTGPQSNDIATVLGWGNHAGLYRLIDWVPSWDDVTNKPTVFTPDTHNQAWETITNPPASIATALQPAATNGWTVSPHLAWITNETDAAALAALATNRVYTTWDTNGHWYVDSGGTRTEYWTTVQHLWKFEASGVSIPVLTYPLTECNSNGWVVSFYQGDTNAVSVNYFDGSLYWSLVNPPIDIYSPYIYLKDDDNVVQTNLVLTTFFITNSITRYLLESPALTNETWGATEQTNWMSVAGTNWVVQSVLDPWWFYKRSDLVSSEEYGADWVIHLDPLITPDPHPQYVRSQSGTLTNATLAGTVTLNGIIYSNLVSQMIIYTNASGAATSWWQVAQGITNSGTFSQGIPDVLTNGMKHVALGSQSVAGYSNFNPADSVLSLYSPAKFIYVDSDIAGEWGLKFRGSVAGVFVDIFKFTANGGTGEIKLGSTYPTYYLSLFSGGFQRVVVTTSGNVGIGTSTPSAKLHVVGSAVIEGNVSLGGYSIFDAGSNCWWRVTASNGLFYASDTNGVRQFRFVTEAP